MNTDTPRARRMMMLSNIFLILPVIFSWVYQEWFYLFLAGGLCIFSPLFHWYRINKPSSPFYTTFRLADWVFAITAFFYMYYYAYSQGYGHDTLAIYILLSSTIIFFWYGWRWGNYSKLHPVFHMIAPLISTGILLLAH